MYAQQMAKGKAALQRGVYSDILSTFDACVPIDQRCSSPVGAYVYGLNRNMPATYAAPIYPFSPGKCLTCCSLLTAQRISALSSSC
jgi:hypothetical protein